jgi:hypothetical protein
LNKLLSRVVLPPETGEETTPTLDPSYEGPVDASTAIGRDVAALQASGLVGLATDVKLWSRPSAAVRLDPPPPDTLPFLLEPNQSLAGEQDHAVATFLRGRRITIVGGMPSDQVLRTLRSRFSVAGDKVRWIGSEKGQRLNLNLLDGLKAATDIVFCITGHISHAGSEVAKKQCRRRGVELRSVEHANEIAAHLCNRHGNLRR